MTLKRVLAIVASAFLPFIQPAAAQSFNQVIVFGDSNVDSGYYRQLASPGGGTNYNNYWATAVAHGAGPPTSSPGLMSSQVLASYFGLSANPSNITNGTNYATSGAKNVTVNTSGTGGFQSAIPTTTQISNYLTANGGTANSQALYLVYSGDNDVSYANGDVGTTPPPDPNAYVTTAANDLANAVLALRNAGAQKIIVAGLAYDFPTNDAGKRALKLLYTNTLWNQLTSLGVTFFRGDIDTVRVAVTLSPAKYGFTTISNAAGNAACTTPSGVTSAWALLCSSDSMAPSTWVSATAPETHLFADDQHLATSGQRLIAGYLYGLVVPPSVTHDFSADGKSDIIWRNTGGTAALWSMNGAQIASSASLGTIPTSWSIVGQRDFDGNGRSDLLWRDSSGATAIWFMNGSQIASSANLGTVPTSYAIAGTGDFNGDHRGDILWRGPGGSVAIWLMNGSTPTQTASLGTVATSWTIAGTGDFDGDGKSDILWRDSSGNTAVWFMLGTQVFSSASLGTIPTTWSVAGTGDFNGDGKTDIVWRNSTGTIAIWLMSGSQILQSATVGTVPSNWSIVETGDFNADGKSDLLFRETSAGTVAIWFMNGTALGSSSTVANVTTDWVIQGLNAD